MRWLLVALALSPLSANAHSFGQIYTLPVPFWLYAWAAIAALLLSFLVAIAISHRSLGAPRTRALPRAFTALCIGLKPLGQLLALSALVLCIATGLTGPEDAYLNVNMTLFWIGFVLAFAYACAVVGNTYDAINPWQLLVRALSRVWPRLQRGMMKRPERVGLWPAYTLYLVFIWFELLGEAGPAKLAHWLIAYTAVNLAGSLWLGQHAWFQQGEFFAVFFRLLGHMAPLYWRNGQLHIRWPFAGLRQGQAMSHSELLFILFMLASTAFDGLHMTELWRKLYWQDVFALLSPWLGTHMVSAYPTLKALYGLWQTLLLALLPVLYWLIYLSCLAMAKSLTGSTWSLRVLALRFAWSLLPIVLVYHASHYYTLILSQGAELPRLLSDPFGLGWNVLNVRFAPAIYRLPEMDFIWHSQVGLILLGHIASVYLAHVEALRTFAGHREAWLSQIPLLLLMMAFTVFGLWILAQPIAGAIVPL